MQLRGYDLTAERGVHTQRAPAVLDPGRPLQAPPRAAHRRRLPPPADPDQARHRRDRDRARAHERRRPGCELRVQAFSSCPNRLRLRVTMLTRRTSLLITEAIVLAAAATLAALTSTQEQWEPLALVAVILVLALASDLFAVSHHGQRISGSFLALVLAMALLGPAPAAAIGVASVLFDQLRARNPGSAPARQPGHVRDLPARRRPDHPGGRRRRSRRRVPAARVRRLPAHEPPELRDDRRPPGVRQAPLAGGRVPQDLPPGAAERDPQRRAVRARGELLRAHRASRRSR